MNTKIKQTLFWCAGLIAVASLSAGASELFKVDLKKHFDLAGIRTPETHYYQLVTKVVRFDLSGKPTGTDEYRLDLMWVPAILAGIRVQMRGGRGAIMSLARNRRGVTCKSGATRGAALGRPRSE